MKVSTYACSAGVCLLSLSGAELLNLISVFEPPDVVFLAAAGGLLSWGSAYKRQHCRYVVCAMGVLFLLAGMLLPALAILTEALVVSFGLGVEALFAEVFGVFSILAASTLPEPAESTAPEDYTDGLIRQRKTKKGASIAPRSHPVKRVLKAQGT